MSSKLLPIAYCLAIAVPLGLALWPRPRRPRMGDAGTFRAAGEGCTPEPEIVETIEALALALRSRGDDATADQLLDALYGGATGTEVALGLRSVLRAVDRRTLQGDVVLLMRAERLLA